MIKTFILLFLLSIGAQAAWFNVNTGEVNQSSVIAKNGGAATLAQTANQVQLFTGTLGYTITFPNATSLPLDWWIDVVNLGATGSVVVKDNGGTTIGTVDGLRQSRFLLKAKGTAAGTWYEITNSVAGGGGAISYASFSATAPLAYNGSGVYSIPQANGSTDGYLSATDWTTFNNSATGNFITDLTGDVTATGPGSAAATVALVGGETAADIATSVQDTQAATAVNTPSTIVKRDGSGNFAAVTITSSLTGNVTGNLTGNVTGNSDTATALAATPTGCGVGEYAENIAANGNLTCTTPPDVGITQLTGDVTAGPGNGSQAATIAADAVTDAKLRESAGLSVMGRSANSTGNPADITAGADGNILRRSGTSIGFGSIDLAASGAVGSSVLTVPNGGTGTTTLAANNVILGNGTSAPTFVAPGTSGNVLTSNGTTWTSAANPSGVVTSSSSVRVEAVTYTNNGSSCAITSNTGGFASITRNSIGRCTLTITTGKFSATPTCTCSATGNSSSSCSPTLTSATSVQMNTILSGANFDNDGAAICVGLQ